MDDPIDLLDLDGRLAHLRSDTARLAACLRTGDLTTPIAACPGWDLRRLAIHLGSVHRWATQALHEGGPPTVGGNRPADDIGGEELAAWLRLGAGVLADMLAVTDPSGPTWHPFPFEQVGWFWSRRQVIETALHRWDAEMAVNGESDLDAFVALMGIGEFFEVGIPRILERAELAPPDASLHLHCTDDGRPDGAGEWIVWNEAGEYRLEAAHRKGDAALRGSAQDLLLVLHGRLDRSEVDIVGDRGAADAWLDLPGW
ncbi:MAG: maleylpyruvate isomerase N-terminal domain-containing protein [Ilumatobacter sp.]